MKIIVINGFNSFIGKHFYRKYKKKYKIIKYKEDINNLQKLKSFTNLTDPLSSTATPPDTNLTSFIIYV